MGDNAKKTGVLRWKGMLGESPLVMRLMVGVVLATSGAAFAFTQLGFIGITLPNDTSGYAVTLLAAIALGALLLGAPTGAVLGMVAGGVLLLHAYLIPLDYYELMYVTPLTSIVMLGVCGALLGILFAFALRNSPAQSRRVVYIIIVCIVVSWLYSLAFATNVIASIASALVESMEGSFTYSSVQQAASTAAMHLGNIGLQAWSTALLMVIACLAGDFIARWIHARKGSPGLRTVFGAWLAVVIALTFMVMAAVSFGVSTANEIREAENAMRSETEHLNYLMSQSEDTENLLSRLFQQGNFDFDKVRESDLEDLLAKFDRESLLQGYTPDRHGTIILTIGDYAYTSTDERFADGAELEHVLSSSTLEAIERSQETGNMERCIFMDPTALQAVLEGEGTPDDIEGALPSIAYVFSQTAYEVPVYSTKRGDHTAKAGVVMIWDSNLVFAERGLVMGWMTIASFVLLLAVALVVLQLLNRTVARRIDEENAALESITAGNLETRANAEGTREFESLSDGINETVDALKGWIAEAEARMDAELAAARTVQESALPRTFPPFPDITAFDVFASMNAAKEVGGDFYDFFLVGDGCGPESGKVAFIVADVSGKGMPAALFMMKAKALLRESIESGLELGEAVTSANAALCDGNDTGMFVTAWVGIFDYGTGHVDYVNAGHNPPLLRHDGNWKWLPEISGMPLGVFELPYETLSLECAAGDAFLLYSDGVTEAFDVHDNLYGEELLLCVAEEHSQLHPRELAEALRADVAAHAEGAIQSDDITILVLEAGVPPETVPEA